MIRLELRVASFGRSVAIWELHSGAVVERASLVQRVPPSVLGPRTRPRSRRVRGAQLLASLPELRRPLPGDIRIGSCHQKMNSINYVSTHVRNPRRSWIKPYPVMPPARCVVGLLASITGVRVSDTRSPRGTRISLVAIWETVTRTTPRGWFVQSGLFSPSSLPLFVLSFWVQGLRSRSLLMEVAPFLALKPASSNPRNCPRMSPASLAPNAGRICRTVPM